ncbi:hypothetical protein FHG66_19500 [Rubellimicrobium rubrum]|uniref:Uncharacterized protein n=1 Tax=Rubellimicrobium rubrum TaxID=2585369 RepID=A0A5C4MP64_9RHOB|nr:hypothetical protein [Rubellimicrobium rubrum]TNC46153.1 hypothetical protein FHG66_19500 [Rubellimicrobium rubrum]
MTLDDYEQIRSQYADIDALCRAVEEGGTDEAYEPGLRRLIDVLSEQQRAPEQIRSFVEFLGAPEPMIVQILGEPSREPAEDNDLDLA